MRKKRNESSTIIVILSCLLIGSFGSAFLLYKRKQDAITPTATPSPTMIATSEPAPSAIPQTSSLYIPYEKVDVSTLAIDNETGFESGWSIQTTDANVSNTFDYHSTSIEVINSGSTIDAASYYRVGIPLETGCTYTITFNASSTIDRNIRLVLINEDTGVTFTSQDYTLTSNENMYSLIYKYDGDKIWNAKIAFLIGKTDALDNSIEHTINLSNIRVVSDYAATAIQINTVGYLTDSEKRCTFIYDAGDFFDVVNADTGSVVYTGAIVKKNFYEASGEYNSYGDFSSLSEPGNYYIRSQIGVISNTFPVVTSYTGLRKDLLNILTIQRCGSNLDDSNFSHPECHTTEALVYGTEERRDVTGGWHDAGDYGRYVKTGTKAVSDLLLAYLYHLDNTLLSEARYEIDWLFKMQDKNGGVFNTVMTPNMSEVVSPEEDKQDLYLLFIETSSTADFAGTMALASIAYQNTDAEYAKKCLDAALNANNYLDHQQEEEEHDNPEGTNGGNYRDESDLDGRFYTKMALYVATNDANYLSQAKQIYEQDHLACTGVTWKNNGGLGRYLFLTHEQSKTDDPTFYDEMLNSLVTDANAILDTTNGNGYNISIYEFPWGSNSDLINNGIVLSMAYDLTGNTEYEQKAYEQISYIFGKNPLGMSFVTGYGLNYPQNIHSRIAEAKNISLPGALVGGPDSYREDIISSTIDASVPDAKVYKDDYECYSTNEITIYWNSALIHLLSRLDN